MGKEITFKLALHNPDKTCEIKGEIVKLPGYEELTFVVHHGIFDMPDGSFRELPLYTVSELRSGAHIDSTSILLSTPEAAINYTTGFLDGVSRLYGKHFIVHELNKNKQINFMPEGEASCVKR